MFFTFIGVNQLLTKIFNMTTDYKVTHHYTIAIRSINYFADKTSSCEWIALLLLNWFSMNVIVIILGVSIVAIENKCNSCISSCPICNNMRFFRKSLE